MNSLDLSFLAYKNARGRLDKALEDYSTLCRKDGLNTIFYTDDVEPFASLNEAIFWAISIFDLVQKLKNDADYESITHFMSAIRFIFNLMKHHPTIFDTKAFSSPGTKISADVEEGENGPIIKCVHFRPTLGFSELNGIDLQDRENQKINYNELLKDRSLPYVMSKLDSAIELLNSIRKS
jgi:hypothetical protein